MRIAVCGPQKGHIITEIEKVFKSQVKKPWGESILDYAAETYKYNNEANVVFDGSVFDFLTKSEGEGYDDVNEQIALDTVQNLNYIIVVTTDMNPADLKVYKEYADLLPGKFQFHDVFEEFAISIK